MVASEWSRLSGAFFSSHVPAFEFCDLGATGAQWSALVCLCACACEMNEISHKPAHAVQNLQGPVSAREHGRTWPTIVGPAVEGEAGHVECGFPAEAGGATSLGRWRRGLGWGIGNGGVCSGNRA